MPATHVTFEDARTTGSITEKATSAAAILSDGISHLAENEFPKEAVPCQTRKARSAHPSRSVPTIPTTF